MKTKVPTIAQWIFFLKTSGVISGFLFIFLITLQFRSLALDGFTSTYQKEDLYYLPPSTWLKVFALGYNEAIADMIWTKCVIYFSTTSKDNLKRSALKLKPSQDNKSQKKNYTAQFVLAATQLDPQFRNAFAHGARLAMYQTNLITYNNVKVAIEILEAGIQNFPEDGDMRFNLGFMYYYELPPFLKDTEQQKKMKDMGANLFFEASQLPNAPPHTRGMAQSILEKRNMDDLVIKHIQYMLLSETDESIRKSLYSDLQKLIGDQVEQDNVKLEMLYQRWNSTYPFIPFSLFTVLCTSSEDLEL